MKQLIVIFCLVVLFSCKSESNKSVDASSIDLEVLDDIKENETPIKAEETFEFQNLTSQKLQELYDLVAVKTKHPEFEESINEQLKSYINNASDFNENNEVSIENLELKSNIITVSDSVQKMKLYYDIVSKTDTKRDSIWAIITTTNFTANGNKLSSKKVRFHR